MSRKNRGMWTDLKRQLIAWQMYENARFAVRDLDGETLRDIGFDEADRWITPAVPFRLN